MALVSPVEYIPSGESIVHEDLVALYQAFEDKVNGLLGGKTPLILASVQAVDTTPDIQYLLGCMYWFTSGVRPITNQWGNVTKYNHQTYLDAIATPTVYTAYHSDGKDEANQTIDLSNLPDALSLEVLKVGDYYARFIGVGEEVAEKAYNYAVAELVFEGPQPAVVTIPKRWDKYKFFRVHNCNGVPLTIQFEGVTTFSVVVPAWGCKAIRRTSTTEGYEAPWNYFWQHRTDDPRIYNYIATGPNMFTGGTWGVGTVGQAVRRIPHQSMVANNVTNLCVLHQWISTFDRENMRGVRWFRDPHEVYDIGAIYSATFGDASDLNTIIGDCLHHKGTLRQIFRQAASSSTYQTDDATFNGYATIQADLASHAIIVTNNGDVMRIQGTKGDLENAIKGTGSNLLDRATADATGYTLDSHKPNPGDSADPANPEVFKNVVPSSFDVEYAAGPGNVTITYQGVRFLQTLANANPIRIWKDKLSDVATLNHFGDDAYKFSEQDTAEGTFDDRSFVLTTTGLRLHYVQRFDVAGSNYFADAAGAIEGNGAATLPILSLTGISCYGFTPAYGTLEDDYTVAIKRVICFDGYGWPSPTSLAPAFVSPVDDRGYDAYSFVRTAAGDSYGHGRILNDPAGPGGADFDINVTPPLYQKQPIKKLAAMALEAPAYPKVFPVFGQPDNFYDVVTRNSTGAAITTRIMPVIYMNIEYFNALAAVVNSITGCMPLLFSHIPMDCGDGNIASLEPNTTGLAGTVFRTRTETTIRPLTQFARITPGSPMATLCTKLGIPLKTHLHFPASFQTYINDASQFYYELHITDRVTYEDMATTSSVDITANIPFSGTAVIGRVDYKAGTAVHNIGNKFDPVRRDGIGPSGSLFQQQYGANGFFTNFFGGEGATQLQEDYHWITIEDVKSAVEALGLTFLYRELAIPLSLERHDTARPEASVDNTPYEEAADIAVFTRTNSDPNIDIYLSIPIILQNLGIYGAFIGDPGPLEIEQFNALAPLNFPGSVYWFRPTATGAEWKASVSLPTVADYSEGTGYGALIPVSGYNRLVTSPLPSALLSELRGQCIQTQTTYHKALVFQRSATSTISNDDSAALLSGVAWLGHASTDYASESYENAASVSTGGINAVPLEAKATNTNTFNVPLEESGETFIESHEGQAHEVSLFLSDQIAFV